MGEAGQVLFTQKEFVRSLLAFSGWIEMSFTLHGNEGCELFTVVNVKFKLNRGHYQSNVFPLFVLWVHYDIWDRQDLDRTLLRSKSGWFRNHVC